MGVTVASEASDLTAAWLTAALREGGTEVPDIVSVTATRIGEGVGFIGQLYRLTLSYARNDPAAPSSIIAKMPTTDEGGKFIGQLLRLYEKEAGFYRDVASRTPLRTPRCYYNGVDEAQQRWCLLLEDMHTYEQGDQLVPRNLAQTEMLIAAMARLHAAWDNGRAEQLPGLISVDDPSVTSMIAMYDDAYEPAMARYGHLIPDDMKEFGPRFRPHAAAWVSEFARQDCTVVHGDYRTDNFVFSASDPNDFAVLDWQLCMRSPGAYDLYYFLAMCPATEVACGHFDRLIDLYLATVRSCGGTPPAKNVLMHQLRGLGLFFGVLGVVTLAQIDPANVRGEELFISMWQRGLRLAERVDLRPALP